MSKIDTVTMEELGRYRTGGSPSRTSVGIGGDVVIASRSGGVTKHPKNPAAYLRQDWCVLVWTGVDSKVGTRAKKSRNLANLGAVGVWRDPWTQFSESCIGASGRGEDGMIRARR